jgi:choice-of-anchor B domain-containing protein
MRTTNPDHCSSGVYMVNIQHPLNPTDAGCINDGGAASDTMCVVYDGDDTDHKGDEICATASDDNIVVHDVSDKAKPELLATLTYDNIKRSHNVWFTPDHNYAVSSDMNDEMMLGLNTRIFTWDFTDVDDPQLIGIYESDLAASDHNLWLHDGYVYIGNFRAGLRMLDASDIANGNLTTGPYFDIIPEDNNTGHSAGAWAVYPFFESDTIAISDKTVGMYLVRQSEAVTAVSLSKLSSPSNSSGLALAAFGLAAGLIALAGYTVRRKVGMK